MQLAIVGILINLAGGISTACGWALQRKAYIKTIDTGTVLTELKWWIGLFLVIISQPLYIVAVNFANQSTLGVVGPFALISNIILARLYLNEIIRRWEYIGIMFFIPGAILTLVFASKENNHFTREQFNNIFLTTLTMTYLLVNVGFITCGLIISYFILTVHPKPGEVKENVLRKPTGEPETGEITIEEDIKEPPVFGSDKEIGGEYLRETENSERASIDPRDVKLIQFQSTYAAKIFKSPRWRLFPLLVLPYSACFCSSMCMTLVRSVGGLLYYESFFTLFTQITPIIYMMGIVF